MSLKEEEVAFLEKALSIFRAKKSSEQSVNAGEIVSQLVSEAGEIITKYPFKSPKWWLNLSAPDDQVSTTTAFYLKTLNDISHIMDWVKSSKTQREMRAKASLGLKFVPFTLEVPDERAAGLLHNLGLISKSAAEVIANGRVEMKNRIKAAAANGGGEDVPVNLKDTRWDRTAVLIETKFAQCAENNEFGKYQLFGMLLPPRRRDVNDMWLLQNVADVKPDVHKNYYLFNENTFVFSEYKTSDVYGTQRFVLDEETFPFLPSENIEAAKELLRRYRLKLLGNKLFGVINFSTSFFRVNGFSTTDARHYWSSSVLKQGNMAHFRKLCAWMAHSTSTALSNYNEY